MKDIERKFLVEVEGGDVNKVKELLASNYCRLDINFCDPLARNALVIAIDNENIEMVKLLIENGIKIGDALLYAIDEDFVEAVELLLDHEEANVKSGNLHSWEQDRENSPFSDDMTPLILAAHRNNFEIIKLLLDRRVSPIPDPHDTRCDCESCCLARSQDCLKHSRSRINAYRALASPCLMALSSPDPLLTAFEMSAKLENLANMEPEYKQDYLRLRAQCQTFATKLLDHTRTSKELEILLNYSDEYLSHQDHSEELGELCCQRGSLYEMTFRQTKEARSPKSRRNVAAAAAAAIAASNNNNKHDVSTAPSQAFSSGTSILTTCNKNLLKRANKDSVLSLDSVTGRHESYRSHMRLARLRLAIHCKQKTFCAHPNIQELLANMWYENLPGFRRKNSLAQAFQVIFIGLMFPIYSIAYLVAPHSQLGRYIKKPFIKFICHSASYITFLIVLILASQRVEAFYSWDSVIALFSKKTGDLPATATLSMAGLSIDGANFTFPKLMRTPTSDFDDAEINSMIAAYRQMGSGSSNGARGLESLSKIFEQLPASSRKRGALPSPIEVIILLWVLSLLWAEIKQVRTLGINYYKEDMWNTLDSVASGFYIGAIILRVVSYCQTDAESSEIAREHWHAYDPTLLSEGLFAAATIFSALKLVYIFSVNPYLGPLQISLGRMIIDILRFSWIYMLVLFSFACGMNQLLWYYADLERHQCLNITNYSLAQYYSAQQELARHTPNLVSSFSTPHLSPTSTTTAAPANVSLGAVSNSTTLPDSLNPLTSPSPLSSSSLPSSFSTSTPLPHINDEHQVEHQNLSDIHPITSLEDDSKPPVTIDDSCKTWRHFSNVFESSQTLFWATFGLVDLENFDLTGIRQYTRFWALLMFGCYCFINVIVVLNLLIAMMNHSYVKISKKSDIEWKFARTRLWMSYFDTGSTVPAPFNIIPSIKSMINLVYLFKMRLFQRLPKRAATTLGLGALAKARERNKRNCALTATYRHVMRSLIRRYLVNEQRLLERKRELTEAKLNRWAKFAAFER